jgi:hypothetical protein
MSRKFIILAAAAVVLAQTDPNAGLVPLTSKHFDYNNLPEVASPNAGERGPQFGVNNCGPKTEGQDSKCQTAVINSVDDWCLWGGPEPDSIIGNTEASSVAWCTKPGHGARTIPNGAVTGVQFIQTPAYLQVTGHIKQAAIDLKDGDEGGEMDPHGADEQGNPLGGLVFSNGFPASGGDKTKYVQAIEWHNFMGGNVFCFKICDPTNPDAAKFCDHIYDRIGCEYNAPAAYVDGVFESCKGENQDFPGHYTDASGAAQVYQQPPESLGAITSIPYVARIPASSECVQYKSADLFAAAASVSNTVATVTSAKPTTTKITIKPTQTGTGTTKSTATSTTGAANRLSGGAAAGIIGALAAFVAAL